MDFDKVTSVVLADQVKSLEKGAARAKEGDRAVRHPDARVRDAEGATGDDLTRFTKRDCFTSGMRVEFKPYDIADLGIRPSV